MAAHGGAAHGAALRGGAPTGAGDGRGVTDLQTDRLAGSRVAAPRGLAVKVPAPAKALSGLVDLAAITAPRGLAAKMPAPAKGPLGPEGTLRGHMAPMLGGAIARRLADIRDGAPAEGQPGEAGPAPGQVVTRPCRLQAAEA